MNAYKKILRIWITITSFTGFLVGWVFLSRTTEPETVTYVGNTVDTMPKIQTIPALGDTSNSNTDSSNVQFFTVNVALQSTSPTFRTGGS